MSENTNFEDQPQAETLADVTPTYNIHLEPPIGTSFWSVQDIKIFSGTKIHGRYRDSENYATLDWSCRCYIFTTNQPPDLEDFAKSGGAFLILFMHRGQIGSDHATPDVHTPNRSTKSGDDWIATIDYEQSMQMFKNEGHEEFTHVAKYNDTFQLDETIQSGRIINKQAEAVYVVDEKANWDDPREIKGLSVFRQNKPSQWPLEFKFNAVGVIDSYTRTISKTIKLDQNFSKKK
ncbi:hypothetical protein EYR40_002482 [Pleurotus pulmonarius]|nr:hypothetical protein EYR40_002482 [Pleurotus pulmonarius]